MFIFFADGSYESQSISKNPNSYDLDGRPSQVFLENVLKTDEIEAIYFQDPSIAIRLNNVDYSMILADSNALSNKLSLNVIATDLARSVDLIDSNDSIYGTAIFIEISELGSTD